ncbi:MAG: hydrogenase expression/formation protein HypE [Planctomycetaceae bacterium]|nr:hydrogenase expression/formation protein HypE [Planctomycetaceae bacterium]
MPGTSADHVQLAHGEGTRASRWLIDEVIQSELNTRRPYSDAAHVPVSGTQIAVATDSHTVWPLFFPGGNIGSLAVYGTVNDLAVSGAIPRWITLSLILEEGLPLQTLRRIMAAISSAATECRVTVVTGDTKVVPRGAADGIFINTTGIGEITGPVPSGPSMIREGDAVLVSGPIGSHGIAVLCSREQLEFDNLPISDSASLLTPVRLLIEHGGADVRCLRDATRGGVSAVLHEWAGESSCGFELTESQIPVAPNVRGACELLGLDPLHVANEGMFAAVVTAHSAAGLTELLRTQGGLSAAAVIGKVRSAGICPVSVIRSLGTARPLDEPTGSPLPRIC